MESAGYVTVQNLQYPYVFCGVSSYYAANVLVTARRRVLVQLLHWLYAASYSENSVVTDMKIKCNTPASVCYQYWYRNLVSLWSGKNIQGEHKVPHLEIV